MNKERKEELNKEHWEGQQEFCKCGHISREHFVNEDGITMCRLCECQQFEEEDSPEFCGKNQARWRNEK